jgi:uncharacterized membrane protein YidH (DUF202 family)
MTPADDIEDADPGLARARTALSWTRTAISFAALGAVILKSRPYAGIPILILSGIIWGLGQLTRGQGPARSGRLLLITLAILGISIAALAIALTEG